MIEEDLDVNWGSQAIILPREQEFFDKLARAGCVNLLHGIESASNPVLHRMRKAETRSMIEETLEKERKAGIKPFGFFITDFIKESWDEYYDTVDFFRENDDLMGAGINTLMIFRNENMPLYSDSGEFDVTVEEPDYDDYIEAAFEKSATYYVDGEPRDERVKQMKWKHMKKTADYQLFLKNFGRNYPLQFAKKVIQKVYRKDYQDYSWLYA
ncbi:MAG: radical SAM protein, partial [Candidatus Nanohaloarchaea archaeon]